MAFDEDLDERIGAYALPLGAERKRMFGGTGYMIGGNLMAGVWHDNLIARLEPASGDAALAQPHVVPFAPAGKPMAGWVMVEPLGLTDPAELERWLAEAAAYASSLPPKK